jgi:alkanesulfonate monooxygenase SsuD/methylene tetrahydromethanopterin reductase-like flavin-dependent oxidoreductase (luciferase family)
MVDPLSEPRVPIYPAVTRRRMARLAGEIADGVIGNTMTSVDWIRELILPESLARLDVSGRGPSALDIGVMRIFQVDDDPAVARQMAKDSLGFSFGVPYVAEQQEYLGLLEARDPSYAAAAIGDASETGKAVADAFVDASALT